MTDIIPIIIAAIHENVPTIQVDSENDLDKSLAELGVDSLDKMSVLLTVQERYNTEFSKEEIAGLRSIRDIYQKIAALPPGSGTPPTA